MLRREPCKIRQVIRIQEVIENELLVTEWCARNGIRLYKKDFDTVSYAKECGISIEMAARDLRYGWFAETARAGGFGAVEINEAFGDAVAGIFSASGLHDVRTVEDFRAKIRFVTFRK